MDDPLRQFLELIAPVRGRIHEVRLFGSRARGDDKPYSDYDLLIVIEKMDPSLRKALYSAVVDVLTQTGRVISLKIFREEEFRRLAAIPTPFMRNVLLEGKVLG